MTTPTLRITEIFHSIQGESSRAGKPCVFIRLTGCPLRCRYCDTEYAFREGQTISIDDIITEVSAYPTNLVEITGGEPLAQKGVHNLITRLCDHNKTVLIETSGSLDISPCDPRAIRILDLKTPGSGEMDKNLLENLNHLTPQDEVKFVLLDRTDYEWARTMIENHQLNQRCSAILLSPVHEQPRENDIPGCPGLPPHTLVEWMLADGLPARLQLQLHKFIWDPRKRGV